MKSTVTTHKVSVSRVLTREILRFTDQGARVVERALPGRMGDVQVVLTNQRGMAELAAAAHIALAGAAADRSTTRTALREARRDSRNALAMAIPRLDGGGLVLVDREQHGTQGEFALTLVHELVHVIQFSRKDVLERLVRDIRDRLGIESQSRRQGREHLRCLALEENEALSRHYLANQLVPGCAA